MNNIEYKQDITKDAEGQSLLNVGLDARREIGKWLNEQPNREVDRVALATLCANFDALISSLDRIVSYYDNRKTPEYGMDMQSKARYENTMFGEARTLLAMVSNVELTGSPLTEGENSDDK